MLRLIAPATATVKVRAKTTWDLPKRPYSSTMHDNDPEVLELEKKRNLSKIQHRTSTPHSHSPGWNEHLASASEASVKADRQDKASVTEMQQTTVQYIRSRHSPEDEPNTSTDSHDQVSGPLSMPSRDHVGGPLSSAEGVEDTETPYVVKKTVKQTTEVSPAPTHSEETVKADRGEV